MGTFTYSRGNYLYFSLYDYFHTFLGRISNAEEKHMDGSKEGLGRVASGGGRRVTFFIKAFVVCLFVCFSIGRLWVSASKAEETSL